MRSRAPSGSAWPASQTRTIALAVARECTRPTSRRRRGAGRSRSRLRNAAAQQTPRRHRRRPGTRRRTRHRGAPPPRTAEVEQVDPRMGGGVGRCGVEPFASSTSSTSASSSPPMLTADPCRSRSRSAGGRRRAGRAPFPCAPAASELRGWRWPAACGARPPASSTAAAVGCRDGRHPVVAVPATRRLSAPPEGPDAPASAPRAGARQAAHHRPGRRARRRRSSTTRDDDANGRAAAAARPQAGRRRAHHPRPPGRITHSVRPVGERQRRRPAAVAWPASGGPDLRRWNESVSRCARRPRPELFQRR